MKTRVICLLLAALTLLPMLWSCGNDTPEDEPRVTDEMSESVEETVAQTEPPKPDYSKMQLRARASVTNLELGLRVSSFTSSDPFVADFESFKHDMRAYIYNSGVTEVNVTDVFGHTASFTLRVSEDFQVSTEVTKCTDSFLEVTAFGAKADDRTDDSAAFQAMIDAAKPGETVYAYPGIYRVSFIRMRDGVTLKLATTMTDATLGYTDQIRRDVNNGRMAVLRGVRIMNNGEKQHGSEGSNDFTITGGVLDMDKTTRGAIIFGCANNVRLENIIFKNIKNNHAIQFTGCTNSSIVNCMFAGYVMGTVFSREVVQIEPSTPGATGSNANNNIPPLWFYEGEYYLPENITIDHCYFGKSDTEGAPLMAIGHHSNVGKANVTGFKITNNVFDECIYAAIRYNNVVDLEITGNTFISTSEWLNNTGFTDETTPAFIIMYHNTGSRRYTSVLDKSTITEAMPYEHAGIQNLRIENNSFRIGAGSDKMVMYYAGLTTYRPGAQYSATAVRRQDNYDSTPLDYVGYLIRSNFGRNVSFCNNEINIEGQPTYTDHFIYVKGVYQFIFNKNTFNLAQGVRFSDAEGKQQGVLLTSIRTEEDSRTFTIDTANTDRKIVIRQGGTVLSTVTTTEAVTLSVVAEEGGDLVLSTDDAGNLYIDIVCKDGYRYAGMLISGTQKVPETLTLSKNASIIVSLTK